MRRPPADVQLAAVHLAPAVSVAAGVFDRAVASRLNLLVPWPALSTADPRHGAATLP